jgi:hypothetical protein
MGGTAGTGTTVASGEGVGLGEGEGAGAGVGGAAGGVGTAGSVIDILLLLHQWVGLRIDFENEGENLLADIQLPETESCLSLCLRAPAKVRLPADTGDLQQPPNKFSPTWSVEGLLQASVAAHYPRALSTLVSLVLFLGVSVLVRRDHQAL